MNIKKKSHTLLHNCILSVSLCICDTHKCERSKVGHKPQFSQKKKIINSKTILIFISHPLSIKTKQVFFSCHCHQEASYRPASLGRSLDPATVGLNWTTNIIHNFSEIVKVASSATDRWTVWIFVFCLLTLQHG